MATHDRRPRRRGSGPGARLLLAGLVVAMGASLVPALAPAASAASVIEPLADAAVNRARPRANFGTAKRLRANRSPRMRSYVKFDLARAQGAESAVLDLTVARGTGRVAVRTALRSSWRERAITFANAPDSSREVVASGTADAGRRLELDVSEILGGPKIVTLVVSSTTSTGLKFASRESKTRRPRLKIGTPTESPGETPSDNRHVLFGSWVSPRSSDPVVTGDPGRDAFLRMESIIGRKYDVDHTYYGFDSPWPTARHYWDRDHGRLPFIEWQPIYVGSEPYMSWSRIAAGHADAIIDARARAARDFGEEIWLSFHGEPERAPSHFGTAADFVAAYRHVRSRFELAGATNVKFVLALMTVTYNRGNADPWYPGGRYVDYVGADGYNWYRSVSYPDSPWQEASEIFGRFYDWSVAKGKPAIIAEAGTLEDPANPNRKANWFRNAASWIATKPNIEAFVYFQGGVNGWWVDSSSGSLGAYREIGGSPLFN